MNFSEKDCISAFYSLWLSLYKPQYFSFFEASIEMRHRIASVLSMGWHYLNITTLLKLEAGAQHNKEKMPLLFYHIFFDKVCIWTKFRVVFRKIWPSPLDVWLLAGCGGGCGARHRMETKMTVLRFLGHQHWFVVNWVSTAGQGCY